MFLFAKLHPHLEEYEKPGYSGDWLSRQAKERIVNRFYAQRTEIPLCIDHREINDSGFVKQANVVGRVVDLFINPQSELMVKCKLDNTNQAAYREVSQGIFKKKEDWGVSVGLVHHKKKDERNLVHVALTNDPGFAKQGTFITHYSFDEAPLDKVIATQCCTKDAAFFAAPEFIAKLKAGIYFHVVIFISTLLIV
jgi:hypothetical protein